MCGLFGGLGRSLDNNDWEGVYVLGILSQFRGIDSAGLAYSSYDKAKEERQYNIIRTVGDTGDLFHTKAYMDMPGKDKAEAVLGHCRAATVGAVNKENAHPFTFDNIIGIHNGTLHSITEKAGMSDSFNFYKMMNENQNDFVSIYHDTLVARDAFAFIWIDRVKNTLNMVRNAHRTLWLMPSVEKLSSFSKVLYASERDFLEFARKRVNGISYYKDPQLLTTDCLYTWDLGDPSSLRQKSLSRVTKAASVRETYVFDPNKNRMVKKEDLNTALIPFDPGTETPSEVANTNDRKPTAGSGKEQKEVGEVTTAPLKGRFLPEESDEGLRIHSPSSLHLGDKAEAGKKYPSRAYFNGEWYILRYLGYHHKLYPPAAIKAKLFQGCAWTNERPNIKHTDVYWYTDKHFIWKDEVIEDDFLKEFMYDEKIWRGQLVYVKEREWQLACKENRV